MKINLIEKANPSDRKSVKLYASAINAVKPKIIFTPGVELKKEMAAISYKIEN